MIVESAPTLTAYRPTDAVKVLVDGQWQEGKVLNRFNSSKGHMREHDRQNSIVVQLNSEQGIHVVDEENEIQMNFKETYPIGTKVMYKVEHIEKEIPGTVVSVTEQEVIVTPLIGSMVKFRSIPQRRITDASMIRKA